MARNANTHPTRFDMWHPPLDVTAFASSGLPILKTQTLYGCLKDVCNWDTQLAISVASHLKKRMCLHRFGHPFRPISPSKHLPHTGVFSPSWLHWHKLLAYCIDYTPMSISIRSLCHRLHEVTKGENNWPKVLISFSITISAAMMKTVSNVMYNNFLNFVPIMIWGAWQLFPAIHVYEITGKMGN